MDANPETMKRARRKKRSTTPPAIVLPPRWRDLSSEQSYLAAARACQAIGGYSFSLDISGKILTTLQTKEADPAGYLAERINAELRALGLGRLAFGFRFEVSKDGKLHLHGMIVIGAVDKDIVSLALRSAAGRVKGRGAARQLDMKTVIYDADGWVGYGSKEADRLRAETTLSGKRLIYINRDMVRIAKQHHEASLPAPKKRARKIAAASCVTV